MRENARIPREMLCSDDHEGAGQAQECDQTAQRDRQRIVFKIGNIDQGYGEPGYARQREKH